MYRLGEYIVYGSEGVCRVEEIGPVNIKGARQDVDYYTLSLVHQSGKLYVPVDGETFSRPVMTREEARAFINDIPNVPFEILEDHNPRLLSEHYQKLLKSSDCRELLKLIRSIHAKGVSAAEKGRRLGQVDERYMKQAEEKFHGELAVALDIPIKEVKQVILDALEG